MPEENIFEEKEKIRMVRILWEVEGKKGVTAITPIIPDMVQWRCPGCDLEWESAHDADEWL